MTVELLVGLEVRNSELYAEYRRLMTPLLHQHQGDFGCDFIVQQSLKPADTAINRVFTIYFASQQLLDSFLATRIIWRYGNSILNLLLPLHTFWPAIKKWTKGFEPQESHNKTQSLVQALNESLCCRP